MSTEAHKKAEAALLKVKNLDFQQMVENEKKRLEEDNLWWNACALGLAKLCVSLDNLNIESLGRFYLTGRNGVIQSLHIKRKFSRSAARNTEIWFRVLDKHFRGANIPDNEAARDKLASDPLEALKEVLNQAYTYSAARVAQIIVPARLAPIGEVKEVYLPRDNL